MRVVELPNPLMIYSILKLGNEFAEYEPSFVILILVFLANSKLDHGKPKHTSISSNSQSGFEWYANDRIENSTLLYNFIHPN